MILFYRESHLIATLRQYTEMLPVTKLPLRTPIFGKHISG